MNEYKLFSLAVVADIIEVYNEYFNKHHIYTTCKSHKKRGSPFEKSTGNNATKE